MNIDFLIVPKSCDGLNLIVYERSDGKVVGEFLNGYKISIPCVKANDLESLGERTGRIFPLTEVHS